MTKVYFTGTSSELKTQISTFLGVYQLISDCFIGQWVGYPVRDYVKARNLERKLYIQLSNVQYPPFTPELGKDLRLVECSVPDPIRSKMDWQKIKNIVGGNNGYLYGRYVCTVEYESGRQTQVRAASESDAESLGRKLADLSEHKIRTLRVTEITKTGVYADGKALAINSERVFPNSFYILSRKKVLTTDDKSKPTKEGNVKDRMTKSIPLWTTRAIPSTESMINSMWR